MSVDETKKLPEFDIRFGCEKETARKMLKSNGICCWKTENEQVFVKKSFMGLSCFFSQGIEFSCHIYCCYNQLN